MHKRSPGQNGEEEGETLLTNMKNLLDESLEASEQFLSEDMAHFALGLENINPTTAATYVYFYELF